MEKKIGTTNVFADGKTLFLCDWDAMEVINIPMSKIDDLILHLIKLREEYSLKNKDRKFFSVSS